MENPKKWDGLAKTLARESAQNRAFLATTQAIDLIEGGVKVNALPEVATGMFGCVYMVRGSDVLC